jgi:Uncharacterized homolog of phage Mu protein gp47
MTYIKIPLETNQSALSQEMFDYLVSRAPGWAPQDGNLDTWIIRAVAQVAADNRNVASDIQDDIFRYFGASLMGIAPLDATPATGNTTWNLTDSLGHTIVAGTTVGIKDLNGNLQSFQVISDVVVPNGSTATSAGAVIVRAVMPGKDANNLGINGTPMQLIDVLSWVADNGVILTGPTAGGQDAETDPAYLDRLTTRLQRLSQRPILPNDFSSMALDADPAVFRVVTIDGFNPADSTYNNQRMVAVASIDANGAASSTQVKANIDSYLQANREINFIVNVINPTFTTINVVTTVVALVGYTLADVQASVVATIQGYLSPKTWGQDPSVAGSGIGQAWIETPTVYYNEVITAVSNVPGVARVTSLTLNGGTANVTLTTPAALPQPGTITATVNPGP